MEIANYFQSKFLDRNFCNECLYQPPKFHHNFSSSWLDTAGVVRIRPRNWKSQAGKLLLPIVRNSKKQKPPVLSSLNVKILLISKSKSKLHVRKAAVDTMKYHFQSWAGERNIMDWLLWNKNKNFRLMQILRFLLNSLKSLTSSNFISKTTKSQIFEEPKKFWSKSKNFISSISRVFHI